MARNINDLIALTNPGNYEEEEPFGFSQQDQEAISNANNLARPRDMYPNPSRTQPTEGTQMAGIAELLKLLMVGGASGAAGAGIGAMGRGQIDPRIAAMQAMQGPSGPQPVQMLDPAAREQVMSRDDLQRRAQGNMEALQGPQEDYEINDPVGVEESQRPRPKTTEQELDMAHGEIDRMSGEDKDTNQYDRLRDMVDEYGNSDGLGSPDAFFDEAQKAKSAGLLSKAEFDDLMERFQLAGGAQDNDADDDTDEEQTRRRGEGLMHTMMLDRMK